MAIFKCKMCGGTIEFNPGDTVGICDSCGTKQTLPRLDDDKKANLYDRANHFRRNNDYDKAMGIYEQILNEDSTDAEAYWSLVLCRYGIEYVEDPATHKHVPTVNRAQFTSIFDDDNYKSALKYADLGQKAIYEEEANTINEIQKGILAISQKEEPFDVFICYKETDNNGRRTQDSVLANDLYHQLTQEGFKVFFSRITLEDKLGTAYEPYIFAALNSAKVMVVIGTKPEYFNAVWVKNEWSRYLALIRNGAKKMLIPACRDMDPYDLPEEFSHLQAQDMSKLGFMQDLIRGIKKIVQLEEKAASMAAPDTMNYRANADGYIERALLLIEDEDYQKADTCLEEALNIAPKNPKIYIGKLMIERQVRFESELGECAEPLEESPYYDKALRFADAETAERLTAYNNKIVERNKAEELESAYAAAAMLMESAESSEDYNLAAQKFMAISDYRDAESLAKECTEKRNEAIYAAAEMLMESAECSEDYNFAAQKFMSISDYRDAGSLAKECTEKVKEIRNADTYQKVCDAMQTAANPAISDIKLKLKNAETAAFLLGSISGYRDADEKAETCKHLLETLQIEQEKVKAKEKKVIKIIIIILLLLAVAIGLVLKFVVPNVKYNQAVALAASGDYETAYTAFSDLGKFKDAADLKQEAGFSAAKEYLKQKEYDKANALINDLLKTEDVKVLQDEINLEQAHEFYDAGNYTKAFKAYTAIRNYDKKSEFFYDLCYKYGRVLLNRGEHTAAINYLKIGGNKHKVHALINEAMYRYINENGTDKGEGSTFYTYIKKLKAENYKDSAKIYKEVYAWKATIIANDDENDETTDMESISKYSNWYFHVALNGGEPGAMTKMKYKGIFPDGDISTGSWDEKWTSNDSGTCWFYYHSPEFGKQGTFKLIISDGNGNKIGEKTVKITK